MPNHIWCDKSIMIKLLDTSPWIPLVEHYLKNLLHLVKASGSYLELTYNYQLLHKEPQTFYF